MQQDIIFENAAVSDMPPRALGPLTSIIIDRLCEEERRLAFAWRECQLLAARNPHFLPLRDEWAELWLKFWQGICNHFGLADMADLTALFFDGESYLHLMRWNRVVDSACLGETTSGWAKWLEGALETDAPWRRHVWSLAMHDDAGQVHATSAVARRIAGAAEHLLATGGASAVTHRAVAAETGLTLGVVSYQCKRTDDLLRLAYAQVYARLSPTPPKEDGAVPNPYLPDAAWAGPDPLRLRAIDELVLAVARGRVSSDLALRLRYLRGRTTRRVLMQHLGTDGDGSMLGSAIFSSLMLGLWPSCSGGSRAKDIASYDALAARLFDRLQPTAI